MMKIEICGNIASGKTTLCHTLSFFGFEPIYEKFQENPFWEKFYCDPKNFAFETELTFMLQHYHDIKISSKKSHSVFDFSPIQDLAYADINLAGKRLNIFENIHEELLQEIDYPSIIIQLICPETDLLNRINKRNRGPETTITREYLELVHHMLTKRIRKLDTKIQVIELNSQKIDFRYSDERKILLKKILCAHGIPI